MEKVHKGRAKSLAEIFEFDLEHYGDINWVTILEAAKLAGINIPKFTYDNDQGE
jgi:hypothetical protein